MGAVHECVRSAALGSCRKSAGLRQSGMPLAVSGYEQEPYQAMVRHEAVRQPDEGSKIQSPAQSVRARASPLDRLAWLQAIFPGHAASDLEHVSRNPLA